MSAFNLSTEICCECGIEFGMPRIFQDACRADSNKCFYCPNGHRHHYTESTADKLRRERDRLKQRIAEKDDAIRGIAAERDAEERRARAYKGHLTRTKKRVGNGVCPCCNRTFKNLADHMKHQHPSYTEDVPAQAAE